MNSRHHSRTWRSSWDLQGYGFEGIEYTSISGSGFGVCRYAVIGFRFSFARPSEMPKMDQSWHGGLEQLHPYRGSISLAGFRV